MKASLTGRLSVLLLYLACAAFSVYAQMQPAPTYVPEVGQEGKDVIWVPTPQSLVEKMLDMAKVTPADFVIDLGSGDGRTVIAAAKRGAHALGIEYNPDMVALARRNAAQEGVTDKAQFREADLYQTDLSGATVITMFLLPNINLDLRPKLLDLKPGTRIVSNSFTMGDWAPDETATAEHDCESYCTAYLWIVPAKVDGAWRMPQGRLILHQTFQHFSGTLTGSASEALTAGRLRGDEISFHASGTHYVGKVNGNRMEGTAVSGGIARKWTAVR